MCVGRSGPRMFVLISEARCGPTIRPRLIAVVRIAYSRIQRQVILLTLVTFSPQRIVEIACDSTLAVCGEIRITDRRNVTVLIVRSINNCARLISGCDRSSEAIVFSAAVQDYAARRVG